MPTYVYECRDCGRIFEADQRIVDPPLTDCDCGATDSLRRLIQPPAVMFKGAGFYVNDSVSTSVPKSGEDKADAKSEVKADANSNAATTSNEANDA